MVEKLIIISSLCILGIKNTAAIISDKQENPSNLFYSSTSFIDNGYVEGEIKNVDRYIVYEDDESTSISNAISICKNVQYDSFYFNDHDDQDFFKCVMNAGDIISVYCNKEFDLTIYRMSNTTPITYYNDSYNNEKIVIDSNSTFCFKITGPSNYTGKYTFKIIIYNKDNFINEYSFVNVKFSNNNLKSTELVSFDDFTSLPLSGYKSGYFGNNNNIPFDDDYSGLQYLRVFGQNVTNDPIDFINSGGSGIFNYNNISTGEPLDDNRKVFDHNTYLASAIPFMKSSYKNTNNYNRYATAFFVDELYAMSAAHMAYDPDSTLLLFPSYITLTTAKHYMNISTSFDINCIELYVPYPFIHYCSYPPDDDSPYLPNQYDWCIMKLNIDNIPSTYHHSYLGVQYPYDDSKIYYNAGYPHYVYNYTNNYIENDDPYRLKYKVLAGMNGNICQQDGVLKTFMDLTHGHSGGPCLYKNVDNVGVAVGIVSGNHNDGTGNIFAPINKYNYKLLTEYLEGGI